MIHDNLVLRSPLFVPGHKREMIKNAVDLDADAVFLDLEDAVPDAKKSEARTNIRDCLASSMFADRTVYCRINDIRSDEIGRDIQTVAHDDLDGFVYPEVKSKEDIRAFEQMIATTERAQSIATKHWIIPLIESPEGVLNAREICGASERNVAVAFGSEDYVTYLRGSDGTNERVLHVPRAIIAMSARAEGLIPIDTVYIDISDLEGFKESTRQSSDLGFEGKLLLHPSQIGAANDVFTPDDDEVERAREIVKLADGELDEDSVTTVDGDFIGPPIVKSARKTLEFVGRIEQT